jgi:hypothetical protein
MSDTEGSATGSEFADRVLLGHDHEDGEEEENF